MERLDTLDLRGRSGQEEEKIAHAASRAGEFLFLLPRSGFYYHRDVTANAGAAFHDMLLSSAHVNDDFDKVYYVHILYHSTCIRGSILGKGYIWLLYAYVVCVFRL